MRRDAFKAVVTGQQCTEPRCWEPIAGLNDSSPWKLSAHIASQCPKLLCLLTSSLQLSPLKQDCHFAESFEEEVFFRPLSHFNIGKLAPFWPG